MAKKKNIFERFGLVESANSTSSIDEALENLDLSTRSSGFSSLVEVDETPVIEVDLQGEDFLTIEGVYEKTGLIDKSESIFKVDEFSKVLPSSLPTEAKRQSVIGILAASSLSVENLITDADERIEALKSVKAITANNTADIVTQNELKIAELLREVDELKQTNNDRKAAQEKQDQILDEEVSSINEIKKFIAPESV